MTICDWYDVFTVIHLSCWPQIRRYGEMLVTGCYCEVLPDPVFQVIPTGLV